jgi:hypothetical protein
VIDALITSWETLNEARLDPLDDEKLAAMAITRTGDALDRVVQLIAGYRANNQRSVTNRKIPAMIKPYPDTVELDLNAGTARIDYCWINSNTLVEVGGNSDGTDRVIDDSISVVSDRDFFELIDGRWLKSGGEVIEIDREGTTCDESA